MHAKAGFFALLLALFVLALPPVLGDQRLVSYDKTVNTPVGKFGIWRITELDPSYTRTEYWVFFGRMGKWHLRTSSTAGPVPLFPLVVLICMTGAVAFAARQRARAHAAEMK